MKGKKEDRQGGPGPQKPQDTLGKTQPEAWVDSTLSNNKTQTTSCLPKRHVQTLVPRGQSQQVWSEAQNCVFSTSSPGALGS